MSRRAFESVLVGAGLILATAIVFARLLANITHAIPLELRDPILNAWILAWDADHLRHGLHGWWDLPILYPFRNTLAFSEHLLGMAVFAAPLEWWTGNPILAYNVLFLASFVFSGTAMFLLVRDITGRSDAAAIAAALYAFYPERVAQAGHLQLLVTGWMPLSLLAFRRYFTTGSRRALAGAAAAYYLQALSNGYLLFYFAPAVVITAGWALWSLPAHRRLRVVCELALAALLLAVAYAPIAREYLHVRTAYGLVRSDEDIRNFSADVGSYLTMPPAVRSHLHLSLPSFPKPAGPEEAHDGMLFPGFAMLALAVVGLMSGPRREVAPYLTIAAAGFVLSLGPVPAFWGHAIASSAPYGWLLAVVPGLDGLRVPARLAVLVYLGLTVAGGIGAAWLLSKAAGWWRAIACAAFVSFIVFEGYGAVPLAEVGRHGRTRDNGLYSWLADQPAGAVLELPVGPLDRNYRGFLYEYNTRLHGHQILNGFTGYMTALSQFLGDPGSPFLAPDLGAGSLEMMHGLGVRYVVVHVSDFVSSADGRAIAARLRAATDRWSDMRQFGDAYVFVVAASSAACAHPGAAELDPVPPTTLRVSASHEPDLLPQLFDGRTSTAWTTRAEQAGDEWLQLSADSPREFRLLRMVENPDILRDYPRELIVEAEGEHGWQRVFEGRVMEAFGRGLARNPRFPAIDVWLRPVTARALRIRQTGRTSGAGWWSIAELQVYAQRPSGE